MGACCGADNVIANEDYVDRILDASVNLLKDMKYNDLLNDIVSKRVDQTIYKKHIKEIIIPQYMNKSQTKEESIINAYNNFKGILETIPEKLENQNNMYTVILFFYFFINHEGEEEDCLYYIFSYVLGDDDGNITLKKFKECLFKYFKFFTYDITNTLSKTASDRNIALGLANLNASIYTNENISNCIGNLLALTGKRDEDNFDLEDLKKIKNKYEIDNISGIRHLVRELS